MNLRSVILDAISNNSSDDPDDTDFEILTGIVMKAIKGLVDEKARGLEQEVMNILKDHGLREFTTPGVRMAVDLVTLVEFMQAEGHLEMETQIVQLKVQLRASESRVENLKADTGMLARFKADCLLAEADAADAEVARAVAQAQLAQSRLTVDGLENQLRDIKK